VTSDELPPGAAPLRIMTRVNGQVMQDSNTDDLIFDVPTLVHELSKVMTLDPGDIIITGTPSGVAMARTPQPWLKPGDVCEVEIEKIGVLRNPIAQANERLATSAKVARHSANLVEDRATGVARPQR
jgi:2-keto-4-pentenoate hydratase/2-oxohepta-3-ene-1,7-dioic acid hydratase in catechol pathway